MGELVPEKELRVQSEAYAEWHYQKYSKSYGAAKWPDLLRNIPVAVKTFFETYTQGKRLFIRLLKKEKNVVNSCNYRYISCMAIRKIL